MVPCKSPKGNELMKKLSRICLFLFGVGLIGQVALAQDQARKFRNISVEQGLSQSTVYAIVQDTLGSMWMATQDGLNRYNGDAFTVYHPVEGNAQSLASNYIRATFLAKNGQLWVGGDNGVSCYNYSTNQFLNFSVPRRTGEWYIAAITQDHDGTIWAGSSSGELFKVEVASKKLKFVNMDYAGTLIKKVNSLTRLGNALFIGTDAGLFKTLGKDTKLQKIELGVAKPAVNDVYVDGQTLWISTEGAGAIAYNAQTLALTQYKHLQGTASSLADNDVRSIVKDAVGNIWIGTFRGLSILNRATGIFENYSHQTTIPYTISQNSVRYIYRDKQNGMWLGTYYGGINYYHQNDIKFNLLSQNTGKLSLNDEVVNVIKQDAKGNFWIGTNDKGLNYWNRQANTMRYYSYQEVSGGGLSSNNIKAIAYDSQGKVLIGTHNAGLNLLDEASGKVKVYRHDANDPKSIAGDMVYALLKDSQSRIWVGTRSGLDQFEQASGSFRHIYFDSNGKRLSSDEITYLMQDSKGRIWVGTTFGINKFYPDNSVFEVYPGSMLSSEVVNAVAEDQKHRIWVGTRNGLNLYDEENRSFIGFKTRKDFPKGTIYGILPDEAGNLWISTNNGLACFNPDRRSTQWFDSRDGLQNNQFNLYAFAKAKDGMLLFGGINGLSYFYPSSIAQQPLKLKVAFTGLEVFGKPVAVNDGTDILEQHIDKVKQVKLKYDQRQFTLYFNTFNYISANRTKYYYRLKGVDAVWQQTDHAAKASYSNLQAGSYVFEVKAVGPNGEQSEVRTMRIELMPIWYRSNWFYLLLVLALATGGYIAYRILAERVKTLQQLKLERLERDKVNHINQMKTDFFTNVSHELRTPLTLILAPLEEILRKPNADKQLNRQHQTMFANAKRLYQLVDQLFEFRKTEVGTRKLKIEQGELVSFVHEIYASFHALAERNQVDFKYKATEAKLSFLFDKDALEKILFNLLSNAFKHTPAKGKITISLSKTDEEAIIRVADSGKGMAAEHLGRIFDRYYQINSEETNLGSGVGLAFTKRLVELHHGSIAVESHEGTGSVFTVKIPLAKEAYGNDIVVKPKTYDLSVQTTAEVPLAELVDLPLEENLPNEEMAPVAKDGQERLLVVDDNPEIVTYLAQSFGHTYHVLTAGDGAEALEVLQDNQVDLIICDVMMPELDGLHFCKRVKQNIQTCHIPIVLLTANSDPSQQLKGLEMGSDDYVTKPFSINLLEAKVQNILRSRKRLKEYYSASKEIVPENIAFNTLDETFLKQAISIIEANLAVSDFSVDKFSREIGMSRSNLYLKLKAITGESVTDFIKRIRFKKAVELMETRQYTIAQVAYMSGFNSPSYFSTAFKQYYDCMPTEYLAKQNPEE